MRSLGAVHAGLLGRLPAGLLPSLGLRGAGDPGPRERAGTSPAVLALHGFGGTPREVELVVEVASGRGLRALAPLLPGHGGEVEALAAARFDDWVGAARNALEELATGGEPVVVVGLSLGAVLAAHLAATSPERVAGLGLLANALWLSPVVTFGLDALGRLGAPDLWLPKLGADIADRDARADHLGYGAQPTRAAAEVLAGGRATRALLGRVVAPTLIVHGLRDRVCPPGNALRAAARLTATTPRVRLLPRSRHIVTRDVEREQVAQALDGLIADVIAGR